MKYFRVTEPHKSGVPHLHISLFVPKDKKEQVKKAILELFPQPLAKIEDNVNNSVAYLMKYILKTFDDFRYSKEPSALTCWYIKWGIGRFYTSRTLVSLNIYRALGGRYKLLELHTLYKNVDISVWLDENKQIDFITENEYGSVIYQKNHHIKLIGQHVKPKKTNEDIKNSSEVKDKPILKSKQRKITSFIPMQINDESYSYNVKTNEVTKTIKIKPVKQMSDQTLFEEWSQFNFDKQNPQRFALLQNELIDRGMIDNVKISPNVYNDEIFQPLETIGVEIWFRVGDDVWFDEVRV